MPPEDTALLEPDPGEEYETSEALDDFAAPRPGHALQQLQEQVARAPLRPRGLLRLARHRHPGVAGSRPTSGAGMCGRHDGPR